MARLKTTAPAVDDDPPGAALDRIAFIWIDPEEVEPRGALRVISDAMHADARVADDFQRARDLDRPHWPHRHDAAHAHLRASVRLSRRSLDAYHRAIGRTSFT